MNIFFREIKANRKSLIIWCLSVVMMVFMGMVKFKSYQTSGQSINDLLGSMPSSLKAILGFGSFDMSKASGYYGMLFLYLQLMAAIHAVMLGAGILAKEERDKTTEFLMTKPVSRYTIITSKLLAAFFNVVILNIITLVSSIASMRSYSNGEAVSGDITKLMLGMFVTQVLFMSIGAGIAAINRNSKVSAYLAAAVLMITFVLARIIDVNDRLESFKYITPFKYFEAENLLLGNGFEPVFVIISIILISVMSAVTYIFYNKRDLSI
ncbi:MAG TPA: ABC transporter permease subunit [Pseudobacteroides sp.]|uniref:ABC transporter permease subunit n=1 Tax=Pseudobacteroides sp. TaxID=1968840 RepID=UPI002F94CFB2